MNNSNIENSLTQYDLKCGMIAYEVTTLHIRTVLFVSDVYNYQGMNSKCIDYKQFYKKDDNIVLSTYVSQGFLSDHNIGASHNKSYLFSDYDSAKEYFDSVCDEKVKIKLPMFYY